MSVHRSPALSPAPTVTAEATVPDDVRALVIAARKVAFGPNPAAAIDELDKASEAFASRIPWEDEPEDEPAPTVKGEGE